MKLGRAARRLLVLLQPAGALLLALAVAGVVILASGDAPLPAFRIMAGGIFNPTGLMKTMAKATPLLFSGLAVALALRAGLFNIGAEGQLVVGGLAAGWAGASLHGLPMALHLPLALLAGAVAGGVWGFVPGLLKAWRGAHEVIVTIMMNYLAFELTGFLVRGPLKEAQAANPQGIDRTAKVLASATLWSDVRTNLSAGFLLAIIAALVVAFLLRRTALGFEIRAVGEGSEAARAAGIHVGRTLVLAMALSGALAGLAGAVEVLAVHHRFIPGFSPGYGYDSIAVALLGGLGSLGVVLSALLFGALGTGANEMEALANTPHQIAGIVQAVVILAIGARYVRKAAGAPSAAPAPAEAERASV